MKRYYLFLFTVFLSIGIAKGQTETPLQSIFDYDTCAPPCWMGLIPGESTAADVDAMLAQHQDLIDPDDVTLSIARAENGDFMFDDDTDELIIGGYSLTISEPYHDMMGLASRIEIRDRVVYEMIIHAHQRITLLEVLENLGEPDIVRLDMGGTERAWLILIYLDLQLRISLIQPGESCNALDLEDEMTVRGVIYLSDEASMELASFSTDVLQPLLTAYRLPEERDVPKDVWQSWLEGEVDMSCEEAWEGLHEPEIIPVAETPIQSIFDYDTCAPPCWMGLIPGESQSEDVEQVLMNLEDLLLFWVLHPPVNARDNEADYSIQGSYRFVWKGDMNVTMRNNRNIITMENSIVSSIRLVPNETIPIEEMLAVLDQPDDIRLIADYQRYYLTFVYLDELMEIIYSLPESCTIATLGDDAEVWIWYHNYESASELVETDYGLQPSLLAYSYSQALERQVPLETFHSWLNSEDDTFCVYAWQTLPEMIELPEFPQPEATELPIPTEESR